MSSSTSFRKYILLIALFVTPYLVQAQDLKLTGTQQSSRAVGTIVDIIGSGFDASATDHAITFMPVDGSTGTQATPDALNGNILSTTVPAGLAGGNYLIQVERTSDNSTSTTSNVFSVVNGGGNFINSNAGITALYASSSDWGDYDGVGDLHLIITGYDNNSDPVSTIYENRTPTIPPVASNVSVSGSPKYEVELSGNYDYSDADGDTESGSTYQWYRSDGDQGTNKSAISGATTQNYTLAAADIDKYLSFEVTPNDGKEAGAVVESNLVGPIHPFAGGLGTKADPYQIATAAQLDSVRNHLDSHFLQTADINLDVAPYNQNDGWVPIGVYDPFVGSYDGGGHTIDRLYSRFSNRTGFFSDLRGDVHNLKLTNVVITTPKGGALAYQATNASLSNIEVSGKVSDSNGGLTIGGLIGEYAAYSAQSISDIKATVTVDGRFSGGIVGALSGNVTIENVVSSQEVSGNLAGGLIGTVNNFTGSIIYSYATGEISGVMTGGLIGAKGNGPLTIENSYSTATVTGQLTSGGVVGLMQNNNTDEPVHLHHSYATGSIESDVSGGLIGRIDGTTSTIDLSNSFWDTDSLGQIPSVGDGTVTGTDGTGLPITKMKRPDTYTEAGWDLDTVWEIKDPYADNISYPRLRAIPEEPFPGIRDESVPVGSNLTVPAAPEYKATLQADYNFTDADDDPERSIIQWYRSDDAGGTNKQAIAGADSSVYTLTKADIHKYISVEVTPSDGYAEDDKMTVMVGEAQSPFDGGRGSVKNPYEIATAEQLNYVREFLECHFIQTADIDLSAYTNWDPIGDNGDQFTGTYNGGGNLITDLTINRPGESTIGLFGYNSGEIYRVGLEAVNVTGDDRTGGLVGDNRGKVYESYTTGSVTSSGTYIGGLIGFHNGGGTITNTYSKANISGGSQVGGLVGATWNTAGLISYSWSSGEVSGSSSVGGIVGRDEASSGASGIFWNTKSSGQNSSAIGSGKDIFALKTKSTFTDANWDFDSIWQIDDPEEGNISYPHLQSNTQDPAPGYRQESAPVAENIAIAGEPNPKETLEVAYTYADADGDEERGTEIQWYRSNDGTDVNKTPIPGATSKHYTLTNADVCKFISVEVTPGDGYISGETATASVGQGNGPFAGGCGTEADPFQIATADQLNNVRDFLGSHFIQTADIDMGVAPYNKGEGWEPIGEEFTGVYDGDNHTISNLFIDSDDHELGLFKTIGEYGGSGIMVKNLVLENVDINSTGDIAGGLTGKLYTSIQNITLSGEVTANKSVGGVVGTMFSGQMVQAHSSVNVAQMGTSANYNATAGGLIGSTAPESKGTPIAIKESSSTGSISSKYYAGGVTGTLSPGLIVLVDWRAGRVSENAMPPATISNSYFSGSIEAENAAGGIIGYDFYSVYMDVDTYDITDSYVTGTITSNQKSGGIVGEGESKDQNLENSYVSAKITGGTTGAAYGDLTGSLTATTVYWDSEATTQTGASGSGTLNGATGLERFAMRTPDAFAGFDFGSTWQIDEIESGYISYPYLVSNEIDSIPGRIKVDPPTLSDNYDQQYLSATKAGYKTEVTDDGNMPVSERGFTWSVTGDFSSDTVMIQHEDHGLGVYADTLKNLPPYTTIYLRSYAKNPVATSFGDITSFKTKKQRLLITGSFSAADKIYDGETTAEFDQNNLALDSVYVDHDVQFDNELEFANKDVAKNIEITLVPVLSGPQADKYILSLEGAPTSTAEIMPRPITITADTQSVEYGNPNPELTYEITSGSLVEGESISGDIARTGNTNIGDYTITKGTLSIPENYDLTFESAPFTITPRTLTVAADTLEKTFGEADPTLTYGVSGFAYYEDESILAGSLTRQQGQAAGTYAIQLGDLSAGENYTIDYTGADFTVNGKELLVTVDESLSKIYGEKDPTLTYSASGFESGDDKNIMTGTLSRQRGEGIGKYEVSLGDLSASDNYSIILNTDSLKILPKTLSVAANPDQTKVYGDEDSAITYKTTGFAFDDDATLFKGSLSREDGEAVGDYEITLGNLSPGQNYDVDFTSSTYNILPETLTVVADADQRKFEGDQDPALTYEVNGFKLDDNENILNGSLSHEEGETPGEYKITQGDLSAGANYEIDFTGADFSIVRTIPTIANTFPSADTNHVAIDTDIQIIFDQEITLADKALISLVDESGTDIPISISIHSDTLLLAISSPLENLTGYTATVGAGAVQNLDTITNDNDEWTFTTIISAPAVAKASSPEDETKSVPLLPEFSWEEAARTSEYNIQVAKAPSFDKDVMVINQAGLTSTDFQSKTKLEKEITYYWRIQSENVGGTSTWSDTLSFTTIPHVPEQVTLTSPKNNQGSVNPDGILKWEAADGATAYHLQLATDQNFSESVITKENISETSQSRSGDLLDNTPYYWRIQASNSGGSGDWSEPWKFTTRASAPKLSFPSKGEDNISIAPRLSWNSGYEDSRYHLKVSTSQNFANTVADTLVESESTTLSDLTTNTTYFWQVRIENKSNTSPWSPVRSFTTRMPPQEDPVEQQIVFGDTDSGGGNGGNQGKKLSSFDYRLVGLPGSETTPVDELFDGKYGKDWKVYEDNGNAQDFLLEHSKKNPLEFSAGRGYWVLSKKPVTINGEIPSVSISENDTYSLTLRPGWNIISNPFNRAASWQQIKEFNRFDVPLYSYEGSFTTASKMAPFSAYYVYNDTGNALDLEIPFTSLDKRGAKRNKSFGKLEIPKGVSLTIADGDQKIQSKVQIAYLGNSKARSKANRYHPPLELSKFGASFIKENNSRRQKLFQQLGDGYDADRKHYQVVVKSTNRQHIHWTAQLKGLAESAGVLVVDANEGRVQILQHEDQYAYMTEVGQKTFDVYVGSMNELNEIKDNLIPTEFTLKQNYPNPFNPTTTIRFGLQEKGPVQLEIFDILGRKVQTLVNETRSAGWHNVKFDARRLASGTYFYRLIIGQKVKTQKMMLIK